MLNIKAFTDDLSKEPSPGLKGLDKSFQRYPEGPGTDLEQDQGVSQYYYGETKVDTKHQIHQCKEEASYKKQKLDNYASHNTSLFNKKTSNTSKITDVHPVSDYTKLFDFKYALKTEKSIPYKLRKDVDNRRFFSQFLSDQASLYQPNSFYSHADFPWLHPSYLYDPHYRYSPPYYYYGEHDGHTKVHSIEENAKSHKVQEHTINSRMTLNTLKKEKDPIFSTGRKEDEINDDIIEEDSPDEEVKKIIKHKKVSDRIKSTGKCTPSQERKNKIKESLKYRPYSLRQRVKASKKAKKIAEKIKKPLSPKYILKALNLKTSTKKELFLGQLGLRKILKRIDNTAGKSI